MIGVSLFFFPKCFHLFYLILFYCPFLAIVKPKQNWEEEEEDDLKENWDDEEEEEISNASSNVDNDQSNKSEKPETEVKKAAQSGKSKKKALKEKLKEKELQDNRPKTAEELLAEKLERQRLMEESDLDMAKDTFGVSSGSDPSVLDTIRLATKEDFEDFRKALENKLSAYIRSPHYILFLETLFRELCTPLDTDDIKKLYTTLTTLYNEKIKIQKVS